jgi:outer membrane protein TolC
MKKILILACISNIALAKDVQFELLWNKISVNGLATKASSESVAASKINSERSDRHWYPTIYATGNSYVTNDPGAHMFGLLSQRSIEQNDFIPDKLNHPESKMFTKGSIGINLPLYEGGMKASISKASQFQYESKKSEDNSINRQFYSEVAKNYFLVKTYLNQDTELNNVSKTLEGIISKYQIGNKANMLGYSGLLGLKSLKNRLLALSDENLAKRTSYSKAIAELSNEEFKPKNDNNDLINLLNEYLPTTQKNYEATSIVKNHELNAKAASEIVGAEKSRNLPRVGAFAESYAFNGDRKTATGYSTGLYLNWNLFSGNDIGAADQAIHNAHAAKYYAEAISQKEKMEFDGLMEMEETLIKTLTTLDESQRLLNEQTTVANNLFKNGMINALQLVEVLSRRVDLLNSKTEVEVKLVETKAKKLTLSNNKPEILK